MSTTYKVLGQVLSTPAVSTSIDNYIVDPSFEYPYSVYSASSPNTNGPIRLGTQIPATTSNGILSNRSPWNVYATGSYTNTYYNINNWGGTGAVSSNAILFGFENNNNTGSTCCLSLGIDYASGLPKFYNDLAKVDPSQTYFLSFYAFKNQAGTLYNPLAVTVYFYSDDYSYLGSTSASSLNPSHTTWTNYEISFTTGPQTKYIGLLFSYGAINYSGVYTANIFIRLDGIRLSKTSSIAYSDQDTDPTTYTGDNTYTAPFDKRQFGWEGTNRLSRTVKQYAGEPKVLYTVPSAKQSIVSTLTISNSATYSTNYRVAVVPNGQTLNMANWIAFDHKIDANSLTTLTIGITLSQGDKIYVASDTENVSFTAFGSEITV